MEDPSFRERNLRNSTSWYEGLAANDRLSKFHGTSFPYSVVQVRPLVSLVSEVAPQLMRKTSVGTYAAGAPSPRRVTETRIDKPNKTLKIIVFLIKKD